MNKEPRSITPVGLLKHGFWRFRCYAVTHISRDASNGSPPAFLIDRFSLDSDYRDLGIGFLILHYGRRGDNAIFFRVGVWGDMPELFHQAYYRDLNTSDYTNCPSSDPIASARDFPIVTHELAIISQAIDASDNEAIFCRAYLRMPYLSTSALT